MYSSYLSILGLEAPFPRQQYLHNLADIAAKRFANETMMTILEPIILEEFMSTPIADLYINKEGDGPDIYKDIYRHTRYHDIFLETAELQDKSTLGHAFEDRNQNDNIGRCAMIFYDLQESIMLLTTNVRACDLEKSHIHIPALPFPITPHARLRLREDFGLRI